MAILCPQLPRCMPRHFLVEGKQGLHVALPHQTYCPLLTHQGPRCSESSPPRNPGWVCWGGGCMHRCAQVCPQPQADLVGYTALTFLPSALCPSFPDGGSVDTVKSFGSSQSRIFDSFINESSFFLAMFSTRFRLVATCQSEAATPVPSCRPCGSSGDSPQVPAGGACWSWGARAPSRLLPLAPAAPAPTQPC